MFYRHTLIPNNSYFLIASSHPSWKSLWHIQQYSNADPYISPQAPQTGFIRSNSSSGIRSWLHGSHGNSLGSILLSMECAQQSVTRLASIYKLLCIAMATNIPCKNNKTCILICNPYSYHPLPEWKSCGKLAASLPQTCSTLFRVPEKLRNSVQKCAASGTLLAHNRLCATESKVVRQNKNCVREVCHNIFLF